MSPTRTRVLALGGCGGMGRFAVRTALALDTVERLTVADCNEEMARDFAEQCGTKTSALALDVTDERALRQALEGFDVVLNTVGPYYRFGVPVLEAAIASGCDYLDICDDWEPTLAMLDLDERARQAGVTAIVGMGASPGISNLLAMKSMSTLDEAEELTTGWGIETGEETETPGEGGSYGAAIEHWLHQCSGTIRLLRDGAFVDVPPLEDITLDYPGLGRRTTQTVGHPEPITLPRVRPELRRSANVMVLPAAIVTALRTLAADIDAGRLDAPAAARQMLEWMAAPPETPHEGPGASEPEVHFPTLFALARGKEGGSPKTVAVTVTAAPPGGMGGATGIPLALGLQMLTAGEVERKGVLTPEEAFDPDRFFDLLAPHCVPARRSGEELLAVTMTDRSAH